MEIIIVDDEVIELKGVTDTVRRVRPDAALYSFDDPVQALRHAAEQGVDVAFLDVEMPVMNGLELAVRLKALHPDINIIFITAYSEFMQEAFRLHASGYLLKPVTEEMIFRELTDLRNAPALDRKKVRISAFGSFTVFVDGRPVGFQYSKSEEILAILVDLRGASADTDRIRTLLWPEDHSSADHASYISTLKKDMINSFSRLGVSHLFRQEGDGISLVTEAVECDYYDYLEGKADAKPFEGIYMERYSWAEPTVAALEKVRRERTVPYYERGGESVNAGKNQKNRS